MKVALNKSPLSSFWTPTNSQIVSIVLFLTLIGIGVGFLSGYHVSMKYTGDPYFFVNKHIKLVAFSILLGTLAYLVPTRRILEFSPIFFGLFLLLLVMVFIPGLGKKISGANRWLSFGFVNFQPSEVMKIGFIIFFAYFLEVKKDKLNDFWFGFIPSFTILFVPVILISIEPDFSTAVILFTVGFLILFASGIPITFFLFSLILSLPFFIYFIQTKKYFLNRFLFLNPEIDPYGSGYHIRQSLFSFKKSGLFGMKGDQIIESIRFFPDTHTDFTFSIIARIGGLAGVVVIILAFISFFYLSFKVATRLSTNNQAERLVVVGIISLFAMELFFHILVTVGLIPTTGILLPFLSYGGTAFVTHFILLGILLRITLTEELGRRVEG